MKIEWKGKLSESNNLPETKVPLNAIQFLEPKSKMGSYIPVIPIIIFIVSCVYIKYNFIGAFKINLTGYIIGLIMTIPFLAIHEILHAICFISKTGVKIFYSAYGLSIIPNEPITKLRYIVTLLFPACIIGIIPLLLWVFIPINNTMFSSICFILSAGNLGGTTTDFYNLVQVIKKMPKKSVMQVSGLKCYYYEI